MIDMHLITETDEATNKILIRMEGRLRPAFIRSLVDNMDEILEMTGLTFQEFYEQLEKELKETMERSMAHIKKEFQERYDG